MMGILIAGLILAVQQPLAAWDFELGPRVGYSHVIGNYGPVYQGTWLLGFSASPYVSRYWRVEIDGTYASHPIARGALFSESRLTALSLAAGVVATVPVARYLQIEAGLLADGRYLEQRTGLTNTRQWTLKPAMLVKAGVVIPFSWGIMIRGGVEYTLHELSGKLFSGLSYTAGVSFGYAQYRETVKNRETRRDRDKTAEEVTTQNREKLMRARTDYQQGLALVRQGNPYEAIPLLDAAAPLLPEAQKELDRVRGELRRELPLLEQRGIEAYEGREYEKCIAIMKRIRLIDPENRTAALYLPRATKRFEALQRLK